VERKIAKNNPKIECDVLKVGHHGSNTSTSAALLSWATPEEAVISVGAKNSYGHPSQDVLDRLSSYRVKTRRTDEEGTIVYSRWVSPWL
ncbi:MAG: hypothetical protein HUJ60_02660, partial [Bacilli bacterium]|nr:hypothetical protein [Bacilli bacterium]